MENPVVFLQVFQHFFREQQMTSELPEMTEDLHLKNASFELG